MVGIIQVVVVRLGVAQAGIVRVGTINRSPQPPYGGMSYNGKSARVATV